ncbi:MAG: pectinesterase family protein, partial [Mangrovibacterium sp.]
MKTLKLILIMALLALNTGKLAAQDVAYEMTVARDGSGDFSSIQAAIDATKAFPDKPIVIHIKKGVYNEKLRVYPW